VIVKNCTNYRYQYSEGLLQCVEENMLPGCHLNIWHGVLLGMLCVDIGRIWSI
jgi:hypothetical protein